MTTSTLFTNASGRSQEGISCLRLSLCNDKRETQLTPDLIETLLFAIEHIQEVVRLVLIEGTPGSFCKGLELETITRHIESGAVDIEHLLKQYTTLLQMIEHLPCPVIALVDGPALGGGVGIAAVADLVLATPQASFALPETLIGLIPAVVYPVLAQRIGISKARLLALGAAPLSAAHAFQFGLVDEVTEDLESVLTRHARRLVCADKQAVSIMKNLIVSHFSMNADYLDHAISSFSQLLQTETTRNRLALALAGEAPWLENNAV